MTECFLFSLINYSILGTFSLQMLGRYKVCHNITTTIIYEKNSVIMKINLKFKKGFHKKCTYKKKQEAVTNCQIPSQTEINEA